MSKVTNIVAGLAALPVLAFSAPALAASNPGQIGAGDIYRAKNVTTNSAFADNVAASCGDTVAFRVRIHNGGPETITNVKVSATLNTAKGTSHGSTVTLSADNNIDGKTVTANAGVTTKDATTASYVAGSTQLLDYGNGTPGSESVIKNLPDGILDGGVNIGSVGPTTPDTEEVQFQAKLKCETPPTPNQIKVCDLNSKKIVTINENDFNASKYSKDLSKCNAPVTPPTTLVNTGAGNVAALFVGVAAVATAAYSFVLRRQNAR